MADMSDNAEAAVVLCESIFAAAAGYAASLPIPVEVKVPLLTFTGGIAAAIFVYWKARINVRKQ